jgi:ribosomal protein S3
LVSGRFSRRDRATFSWKRKGIYSLSSRCRPISYGVKSGVFRYGKSSIKLWLARNWKRFERNVKNKFFVVNEKKAY